MTKRIFLLLAFGSLVLFSGIAWLSMAFFGPEPLMEVRPGSSSLGVQLSVGVMQGVICGVLAWGIVSTKLLSDTRDLFRDIFAPMRLNLWEIIFVSCCAGIGEELLFRGAIQPFLGIWWTSILFVVIHGYLNPMNWRLSIFGAFMVLAVASLGYAAAHFGLLTAIAAHIVIDIILLAYLVKLGKKTISEDIPLESQDPRVPPSNKY